MGLEPRGGEMSARKNAARRCGERLKRAGPNSVVLTATMSGRTRNREANDTKLEEMYEDNILQANAY